MPSLGSFQDYLGAAVQLKTALVKANPARREWENAPPFLRCTASTTDVVLRARQGGFSIQYSTAVQLKEQGNELIGKNPEAALELYTQALSVFLWFDRGPDRASEEVPLVCAADSLQEAEREQAYHLLSISFCNAAACLLQLGMLADAVYACSKALKYDPYSVKALYRRALAHRQSDTTAGLEAALEDLREANQLEPANNQVRVAMMAVQQELREHRRRERGLYGSMFERGEIYADGQGQGHEAQQQQQPGDGVPQPPWGDRGGGTAAGAEGAEGVAEAEEVGGERDPEDLQLLADAGVRKVDAQLASREADLVLRRMQRALAQTRNRRMAEQLDADRARRAARFPWWAVPWWAYVLIVLHLAYRLIKIWKTPLPAAASHAGAAAAPPAVPLSSAHQEL